MTLAQKLLGAVLAVVGAALLVVGLWFAGHLGGSGTATFDARPATTPVVIEPSVLNRLDEATTVTVVPTAGRSVWLGVGAPSDVRSVIGTTRADHVTSVVVRDWSLVHHVRGTGAAADPASAEIWRERHTGSTPVTATLEQSSAPQTVVVTGGVERVELSWSHGAWFAEAVVVAVLGLLLLAAGAVLVVLGFRRRQAEPSPDEETTEVAA